MTEPNNDSPDLNKGSQNPPESPNPYGTPNVDPYGSTQYGSPQYGAGQQPGYGQQPTYGEQPNYGAQDPQAGYGAAPGAFGPGTTPPQYGAPGVPGAPAAQVNIGEALSWAWAQFKAKPGPMIIPGAIMFVIGIVTAAIWLLVGTGTTTETQTQTAGGYTYSYEVTSSTVSTGGVITLIVLYLVVFVALVYLSAAMITGALRVADGQLVTASTFLKPDRLGPVIGAGILVGLITAIGLVLCVIPGLIAIFLLQFTVFLVIDQKLSPTAAMSASSQLARSSVSNSLVTLVVAYALSYVGTLLCYVGLIVTWPIGQLFYAHCYRRLSGGYVAPAPQ